MNDQSSRIDGYYDTDGAWLGTPVPLKLHVLSRAYRPELFAVGLNRG